MKYVVLLLIVALAGCQPAVLTPNDYIGIISCEVGLSTLGGGGGPSPVTPDEKVPRSECQQCNGTGRITHGDGHTSECPSCYADATPPPAPTADPVEVPTIEQPEEEPTTEHHEMESTQDRSSSRRGLFRGGRLLRGR